MKRYNTIYYLLFVLLIMGAFAAMAQNYYGVTILGLVAVSFSLLFLIQLISFLSKKERDWSVVVELISLAFLAGIMALRVFYIYFEFLEMILGIAGVSLILVYLRKTVNSFSSMSRKSKRLTGLVLAYYFSIILYLLSMIAVPFFPSLSEPAGVLAFGLLISFIVLNIASGKILYNGENVSGLKFVTGFKDLSIILITLFLLFTAYMGLNKIGIIPKMYSDEFPQSYFELVNRAETGKEKAVNGKYKHEEFKKMYDRFVERNITARKK